jgi:hypothetical protein
MENIQNAQTTLQHHSYGGLVGVLPPLCNKAPYAVASLLQPRTGTEQTVFQAPCGYIETSQALFGLSGPAPALSSLLFGALNEALAPSLILYYYYYYYYYFGNLLTYPVFSPKLLTYPLEV